MQHLMLANYKMR